MTKIWMFSVWFITIVAILPFSYSYDDVNIEDRLQVDGSVREFINITFSDNIEKSYKFTFPVDAYDMIINGNESQIENNSANISLDCTVCVLSIAYSLNEIISAQAPETFTFSRTLNLPRIPKNLKYSIYLPRGHSLSPAVNEPSVVPLESDIETDGESIIIHWSEKFPEFPKRYYVAYRGPEYHETIWDELKEELSEGMVWFLMILFLLIGFASGIFIAKKFPGKKQMVSQTIPSSLLGIDEKKILELLKENKNTMNQKEIGQKLEWSKSKVSSIMTNLEHKQIIKREKFGRNYKVTLIKEIEQ